MTGFPSPSQTPPTAPDPNAHARRAPAWPTVVGVIALVFGILGVLGGLWGMIWQILLLAGALPEPWSGPEIDGQRVHALAGVVMQALGMLLAAALAVGGVLLMKRKRAAVRWLMTWAVVKLTFGVIGVVYGAIVQHAMFEAMQAQPGGGAPPAGFMSGLMIGSVVVGLAWVAALPVFMLIWFTRARVRLDIQEHFEAPPGPAAP